jgi:hypothetical protein
VAGFLVVVPQLLVSWQVLVWLLFVHPVQSEQDQFSWQHDWLTAGLLYVEPVLRVSVQVLVCWPFWQFDQSVQLQYGKTVFTLTLAVFIFPFAELEQTSL